MPLTDTRIRNARPKAKPYKLKDGNGLVVLVMPNGSKLWRRRLRVDGSETMFALGRFPDVTLAKAREAAREAFKLAQQGINPATARKANRAVTAEAQASTFRVLAKEWLERKAKEWAGPTALQRQRLMEHHLYPHLDDLPVGDINSATVHAVLEKVHKTAPAQTAFARQCISGVMGQAIIRGLAKVDPVFILRGHHKAPKVQHHRPLEQKEIRPFFKALDAANARETTRAAVKLAFWTLCRSKEVIGANWSEFDLEAGLWTIPAERMKRREQHVVPLPSQAVEMLGHLHQITSQREVLFANGHDPKRPAAATFLNKAVVKLGFEGFTAHGVRSTGSTMLHDMKFRSEVIEHQLAHVERNKTKASYNHATYLEERRAMMQHWADFLDGLCAGGKLVPIKKVA